MIEIFSESHLLYGFHTHSIDLSCSVALFLSLSTEDVSSDVDAVIECLDGSIQWTIFLVDIPQTQFLSSRMNSTLF